MFRPPVPEVPHVTAEEAEGMLAAGAVLVDIREPNEWHLGRIPGAELHPLSSISEWWERLPRDRPVILQCRSGERSALATEALLHQAGLENVVNLQGGIIAWANAGLPIEGD